MEQYTLLFNDKNTKNKDKWTKLKKYIKKYNIKKVEVNKYFKCPMEEKVIKLKQLADNTVNVDLEYAGLEHLINLRIKETPTYEQIVLHPRDYLKSFILIISNEFKEILEVIPNGTDRLADGGAIVRYFTDYEN